MWYHILEEESYFMSIMLNPAFKKNLLVKFVVKYHQKIISSEVKNNSLSILRLIDFIIIVKHISYSFRMCRFYFATLDNRVRSQENTTQVQIKNNSNANEHSHWMVRRGVFEAGQ